MYTFLKLLSGVVCPFISQYIDRCCLSKAAYSSFPNFLMSLCSDMKLRRYVGEELQVYTFIKLYSVVY